MSAIEHGACGSLRSKGVGPAGYSDIATVTAKNEAASTLYIVGVLRGVAAKSTGAPRAALFFV